MAADQEMAKVGRWATAGEGEGRCQEQEVEGRGPRNGREGGGQRQEATDVGCGARWRTPERAPERRRRRGQEQEIKNCGGSRSVLRTSEKAARGDGRRRAEEKAAIPNKETQARGDGGGPRNGKGGEVGNGRRRRRTMAGAGGQGPRTKKWPRGRWATAVGGGCGLRRKAGRKGPLNGGGGGGKIKKPRTVSGVQREGDKGRWPSEGRGEGGNRPRQGEMAVGGRRRRWQYQELRPAEEFSKNRREELGISEQCMIFPGS